MELGRIPLPDPLYQRASCRTKNDQLFTGELEQALLRGDAHVAVHSCKDLPGENTAGLIVAGYLPREDVRDVLILREGVTTIPTL